MYRYDQFDAQLVGERVAQFRDQVRRRMSGALSEEEFRPLRLLNGLYLQLHAYMLRVAIPYGTVSATQMRMLARIARRYDRGYGHFTTRQNIQYNWTKLEDAPDILADLASVEMHAIQTSGNTIRNITADPFAGVAANEIEDPRIYCEAIRQWSTLHPEFTFLPRKFKIAVTGTRDDRAAIKVHDIGLALLRDSDGAVGFEVMVGGGQGRTPMIAKTIREFLPKRHLLSYLEAILRVYNLGGRRDNKYKARIKILVHETGVDDFRGQVEAEWERMRDSGPDLDAAELARIAAHFVPPEYDDEVADPRVHADKLLEDKNFAYWARSNVAAHRRTGYAIANISLKPEGGVPGDATA
ncbi:MAG: nitrite/sulfite reductase, partial [Alphaproteobacteria bacterium]